jgi:hypothetical protein
VPARIANRFNLITPVLIKKVKIQFFLPTKKTQKSEIRNQKKQKNRVFSIGGPILARFFAGYAGPS